jgi:serine/threonine-protein kinase RIO1
MPNDTYLDSSVQWRIKAGTLDFHEAGYRSTVEAIRSAGLAAEVVGLNISAGKEADVYLCHYKGAELAIKAYMLYRTSHRGGGPIKVGSIGYLAAHECEMTYKAWKASAPVPTPARRVENMFSMRYMGDADGPAPRLKDVELDNPKEFLELTLAGIEAMAKAGVVHGDLSAFNILVLQNKPRFIDFSEAVRVDRTGMAPWMQLTKADDALTHGLEVLQSYFRRYDLTVEIKPFVKRLVQSLDKFGVMS